MHDDRHCYGRALKAANRWQGRDPSFTSTLRAGGEVANDLIQKFAEDRDARCYRVF
jgi:hypothetical protein